MHAYTLQIYIHTHVFSCTQIQIQCKELHNRGCKQCVAVCCSVLQCVAVCCGALQFVAVCLRNRGLEPLCLDNYIPHHNPLARTPAQDCFGPKSSTRHRKPQKKKINEQVMRFLFLALICTKRQIDMRAPIFFFGTFPEHIFPEHISQY